MLVIILGSWDPPPPPRPGRAHRLCRRWRPRSWRCSRWCSPRTRRMLHWRPRRSRQTGNHRGGGGVGGVSAAAGSPPRRSSRAPAAGSASRPSRSLQRPLQAVVRRGARSQGAQGAPQASFSTRPARQASRLTSGAPGCRARRTRCQQHQHELGVRHRDAVALQAQLEAQPRLLCLGHSRTSGRESWHARVPQVACRGGRLCSCKRWCDKGAGHRARSCSGSRGVDGRQPPVRGPPPIAPPDARTNTASTHKGWQQAPPANKLARSQVGPARDAPPAVERPLAHWRPQVHPPREGGGALRSPFQAAVARAPLWPGTVLGAATGVHGSTHARAPQRRRQRCIAAARAWRPPPVPRERGSTLHRQRTLKGVCAGAGHRYLQRALWGVLVFQGQVDGGRRLSHPPSHPLPLAQAAPRARTHARPVPRRPAAAALARPTSWLNRTCPPFVEGCVGGGGGGGPTRRGARATDAASRRAGSFVAARKAERRHINAPYTRHRSPLRSAIAPLFAPTHRRPTPQSPPTCVRVCVQPTPPRASSPSPPPLAPPTRQGPRPALPPPQHSRVRAPTRRRRCRRWRPRSWRCSRWCSPRTRRMLHWRPRRSRQTGNHRGGGGVGGVSAAAGSPPRRSSRAPAAGSASRPSRSLQRPLQAVVRRGARSQGAQGAPQASFSTRPARQASRLTSGAPGCRARRTRCQQHQHELGVRHRDAVALQAQLEAQPRLLCLGHSRTSGRESWHARVPQVACRGGRLCSCKRWCDKGAGHRARSCSGSRGVDGRQPPVRGPPPIAPPDARTNTASTHKGWQQAPPANKLARSQVGPARDAPPAVERPLAHWRPQVHPPREGGGALRSPFQAAVARAPLWPGTVLGAATGVHGSTHARAPQRRRQRCIAAARAWRPPPVPRERGSTLHRQRTLKGVCAGAGHRYLQRALWGVLVFQGQVDGGRRLSHPPSHPLPLAQAAPRARTHARPVPRRPAAAALARPTSWLNRTCPPFVEGCVGGGGGGGPTRRGARATDAASRRAGSFVAARKAERRHINAPYTRHRSPLRSAIAPLFAPTHRRPTPQSPPTCVRVCVQPTPPRASSPSPPPLAPPTRQGPRPALPPPQHSRVRAPNQVRRGLDATGWAGAGAARRGGGGMPSGV